MSRAKEILEIIGNVFEKGKVVVYDNGGKTADRYTVIIGDDVYGMSDNPDSPQGFNQYSGTVGVDVKIGKHLGKKLSSIPDSIKKAVKERESGK